MYFLIKQNLLIFDKKNTDASRMQEVRHMIHIFFGSSLDKVYLCQVSSLQDMCDRFYGGVPFCSPHPRASPKRPILNRVKVTYSWTDSVSQIIKGYNKKVTQIKRHHKLECNCRIKNKYPFSGNCRKEDVMYRCTALTTFQPQ